MSIDDLAIVRIAREESGAVLKWWVQELRELAEALLEHLAPRLTKRLLIRFGDQVATACTPRGGKQALNFEFARDERGEWPERLDDLGALDKHQGARATLVLAPSEVFKFDLILPEVPERDLKAMIELHLEREWPVSRDRFAVDYWITQRLRSSCSIRVQVLIARHEHLERLRGLAQGWGLRPVRIGAPNESEKIVGDFLPRRFRFRPFRSLALVPLERRLAAAVAVLAFALVAVIAGQWAYERLLVSAALARVSGRATVAVHLAQDFARESLPAWELLRIAAHPDAVDALESLTRSIPANAWVYKLDISAPSTSTPQIRLTAFAPAAATLVDILQRTHHFGTVHLDWAVSNGTRSGLDQLQLTTSSNAPHSAGEISNDPMP
ncbi:MAG: hypothetical protein WBW93_09260 [Steroidobacteraceae bacterium]